MADPVRLMIAANEPQAEMICGMLRAEGLVCATRITDLAFGQGGEFPLSGGGPREVLVRPEDLEMARQLIQELDSDSDDLGMDVT